MFPFHYRRAAISTLFVSLAFLALTSCGGERGSGGEPPPVACGEGAASGETVVCSVAGMNFSEDCTVFFGTSPVAATFEEAEGTITFIVPPSPPGSKQVSFQCGAEDPQMIDQNFAVVPSQIPNPPSPSPIIPTPPDTGTTPGPTVENPEPAPTVMSPMEIMFPSPLKKYQPLIATVPNVSLEVVPNHNVKLGFIQLKWKADNAQKVYLYGPFNRVKGDAGCGVVNKRFALVNKGSGTELISGFPSYNDVLPYLEGVQLCDEDANNCLGYKSNPDAPPFCRINLTGTGGTLSTRFYTNIPKFVIAAQRADGIWEKAEAVAPIPPSTISNVEIKVDKIKPVASLHFSYSNALSIGAIGCEAADPAQPLPSPLKTADGFLVDSSGTFYHPSCKLKEELIFGLSASGLDPSKNKPVEVYSVELAKPTLTLKAASQTANVQCDSIADTPSAPPPVQNLAGCYYKGEVEIEGTVTRSYVVKKREPDGETFLPVGPEEKIPWVKALEIEALSPGGWTPSSCGTSGVKEGVKPTEGSEKLGLTTTLPWNGGCSSYRFKVTDFDDTVHEKTLDIPVSAPPEPAVAALKVFFQTGNHAGAGTDGKISMKFCPTSDFNDPACTQEFPIDPDDGNNFEKGDYDSQVLSGATFGWAKTLDKVKYFRIRFNAIEETVEINKESKENGAPQEYNVFLDKWLLTGLQVNWMDSKKSWHPLYVHPCLNRVFGKFWEFDDASFSYRDTAVCLNTKTGAKDNSGTDDKVSLNFPTMSPPAFKGLPSPPLPPLILQQTSSEPLVTYEEYPDPLSIPLNWGREEVCYKYNGSCVDYIAEDLYDDFEKGDFTSYAATFFDNDPIDREFRIEKTPDGDSGGWFLECYELWLFRPGDPSFLRDNDCQRIQESPGVWLGDSSLGYPSWGQWKVLSPENDCSVLKNVSFDKGSVGGYL